MTQQEFQNRFIYNPTTDRLGKGGFGEVFKAYDTYRDRWVAVKMAKVETDHESVRLSKEVELVNKLPAHPNIAYYEECFTFSSFAGEYDFGILQYYEAGNLQQLIDNNNLTFAQKQNLLTQLLEGIGFLHDQGIIHRDLKPANILIVKRGEEYIPKITDFGISKKLDINNSSIFSNSLAGAGTLSFASPEQLGGTTIRKNTDLWSFGVIAYWLFAGELPFNTGIHGTTSEAGRAELFTQIARGALPQGITSINQPWRKLIVACLETDSEKRARNIGECKDLLSGNHNNNQSNNQDKTRLITNSDPEPIKPTQHEKTINQQNEVADNNIHRAPNKTRTILLISIYAASVIFALIACFVGESNRNSNYDYSDELAVDTVAVVDTVALSTIYLKDLYTVNLPSNYVLTPDTSDVEVIKYMSDYVGFECYVMPLEEYDLFYTSTKELLQSLRNSTGQKGDIYTITLDNGMTAYQLVDEFDNDGSSYFSLKTAIKIKKNYVYLNCWCYKEQKDTYLYEIKAIQNSLTEL